MTEVVSLLEFDEWLEGQPAHAKARILARIRNMMEGNNGDCDGVGEGVSEARIHWGPGIRLYFVDRNGKLTILLCGGDKSTQKKDIERAIELSKTV